MKILLASHQFFPDIGGIEGNSQLLARGFVAAGHQVVVVTTTKNPEKDDFPFQVVRAPNRAQLLRWVRWCDVFFHNNISLQTLWPLLFVRRPWVVAHRTWIARNDGSLGWQDRLKRFLLRFARAISISQAVADHISTPSTVIGNPYRDDLFFLMPHIARDRELAFLGRLVSDKGVDLALEAMRKLRANGLFPRLTIIGNGPEQANLEKMAQNWDLGEHIEFVGAQSGETLRATLNRHQILLVPSRWKEPFGIVALEGAACGCVVVGSEGGGLKDAIGEAGLTFPNGDANALFGVLHGLLTDSQKIERLRQKAPAHLEKHKPEVVVAAYLRVIESAAK